MTTTDRHFLALDIETVPHPSLDPSWLPVFTPEDVKLGNLKDAVKIREKVEEARASFESNLRRKAGLDPDLMMICCCVMYDSHENDWLEMFAKNEEEESEMLFRVVHSLDLAMKSERTILSYNGRTFDIPAIYRRCQYQDVRFPRALYRKLTDRYALESHHLDLMQALGMPTPFSSQPVVKKMAYYLSRFGLTPKLEGWSGADVWPAFQEGRFDEITAYCRADVEGLVELYRRVEPWLVDERRQDNIIKS